MMVQGNLYMISPLTISAVKSAIGAFFPFMRKI